MISDTQVSLQSGNLLRQIDNKNDTDDTLKVVSYNVENREYAFIGPEDGKGSFYTTVDIIYYLKEVIQMKKN